MNPADLTRTLDAWERERDLSGSFLVTRGEETVFEHCVGYADRAAGRPVTPSSRFGLASLSKLFTAATVAALVSEGRLDYATPVVDLVAPERRPSTLRPDVTVHHLLCHTSGIADYCEEDEDHPAHLDDYAKLFVDVPSYSVATPADYLRFFVDLAPYGPPGVETRYCNAGYVVLGLVVEDVTGQAFADAVQERVLDRAGMAATGYPRLDEPVGDTAVGYPERPSADAPWRTNVYSTPVRGGPDGGAFSTARDLDRFLTAYADGSLLGDQHAVVTARQAEWDQGYAFGYGVLHYPDGRWGHGGGDPGVEVLANVRPGDPDLHVVVLCNTEVGLAGEVRDLLLEASGS